MKAWEALQILESLPADTEVTLTIGRKTNPGNPPVPTSIDVYGRQWVIGKDSWPARHEITCKTVH